MYIWLTRQVWLPWQWQFVWELDGVFSLAFLGRGDVFYLLQSGFGKSVLLNTVAHGGAVCFAPHTNRKPWNVGSKQCKKNNKKLGSDQFGNVPPDWPTQRDKHPSRLTPNRSFRAASKPNVPAFGLWEEPGETLCRHKEFIYRRWRSIPSQSQ